MFVMSQGEDDCSHDQVQQHASDKLFPQRRKMGNSRKRPLNSEDFVRTLLGIKKVEPTGQQGQQQVKELEVLRIQEFHRMQSLYPRFSGASSWRDGSWGR